MILLIDNYDSFVYNLAQYIGELGWEPVVHRNDAISLDQIESLSPSHIVVSRGPVRRWRREYPTKWCVTSAARYPSSASAWAISASVMSTEA